MVNPVSQRPEDREDQRDRRRDVLLRFQVGGVGLTLVLLLVTLSTLLTGQAREEAELAKAQAEAAGVATTGMTPGGAASGNEPLADLGVEPSAGPAPGTAMPPAGATATPGPVVPVVPDLEPDPRLRGAPPSQ